MITKELEEKFEKNISAKEKARLKRDKLAAIEILLEGLDKDELKAVAKVLSKLDLAELNDLFSELSPEKRQSLIDSLNKQT